MNGFVYLCSGPYSAMVDNSVASLLAVDPKANVVVVRSSLEGYAARRIKTQLYKYSPFDVTCYVDADTTFAKVVDLEMLADSVRPGTPCFMAAADPYPTLQKAAEAEWLARHVTPGEISATLKECPMGQPFYNGGVVVWRKSPVIDLLFQRWHYEWKRWQCCDQFALARAIAQTIGVQASLLPGEYNNYVMGDENLNPDAYVHHFISGDKLEQMKKRGEWRTASVPF